MAIARDWLKTLWRTSYKGAAFWVETDTEGGARRIVIHEFPMRDTPFLEDLGERYREFTVTAYVASDRADSEAAALMTACATRGAGILIVPTQGPVTVRCLEFARKHEKDKLGYIAHELRFVREGSIGSLVSVASLVNMIFIQAEAVASVVAEAFAAASFIQNVPDYVAQTLQSGTETALATMEAVRVGYVSNPEASSKQRDLITATYDALPQVISSEDVIALQGIGESVMKIAASVAENMDPQVGVAVLSEVLSDVPIVVSLQTPIASVWRKQVEANAQSSTTLLRISTMVAYCEAVARIKLGDRNSAITLRANVASYFDQQLEALPSEAYELFHAMTRVRDATIEYLSRTIIDLAPVVRVETNLSMPSLYWAWRLYADPTRAMEIVDRNRVPHPSLVPRKFEALGK